MRTRDMGTAVTCVECDCWGRVKPTVQDRIMAICGRMLCAKCAREGGVPWNERVSAP